MIVKDGRLLGVGWTQPGGRPHAETEALKMAGEGARGATAYVTLEPCAHHGRTGPCAEALVAAGIARVVTAIEDPDPRVSGGGHAILERAGIAFETGLVADEARRDMAGLPDSDHEETPQVILKMAFSADGKIAGGCRPAHRHLGRGGQGPRPPAARPVRCDPGRHGHGAGGRPGAHLPLGRA